MAYAVWVAIDGKQFTSQQAALLYEANLVRKSKVLEILQQFDMSPMVRDTLADFIVNNRAALTKATQ